jgi:hypothetical protein
MENFYVLAVFPQPVIHTHRRMEHFANAWFPRDRNTNAGQALEQLYMFKQGDTKLLGGVRVVGANVIENDF